MVWVVIDTNQVIRMTALPKQHLGAEIEGISLPPFVLGELLRSNNRQPLARLAEYSVRIGMTPGEVMARIAPLRRSQIVNFRPFHNLATQKVQETLQAVQHHMNFFKIIGKILIGLKFCL
jgi:hypothetical protein